MKIVSMSKNMDLGVLTDIKTSLSYSSLCSNTLVHFIICYLCFEMI